MSTRVFSKIKKAIPVLVAFGVGHHFYSNHPEKCRTSFETCKSFLQQPFSSLGSFQVQVFNNFSWPSKMLLGKTKSELMDDFESAHSFDKMLTAFKKMEWCFEEEELAPVFWTLACKSYIEKKDPYLTLYFGKRYLNVITSDAFDKNNISVVGDAFSIHVAMVLCMLGTTSNYLQRFGESLGYFKRANDILVDLDLSNGRVLEIVHITQRELYNVKAAMGKMEEAIPHLRKVSEIEGEIMNRYDMRCGITNMALYHAYLIVGNFEEALRFCLKTLDIFIANMGENSQDVAWTRMHLGIIYGQLKEYEKALEQVQLNMSVLKKLNPGRDLMEEEIWAATYLTRLGRYRTAIELLEAIVPRTGMKGEVRATVYIEMARVFCCQKKFAEAKRCLEEAGRILDTKEICHYSKEAHALAAAVAFNNMSTHYKTMNEFETALSYLNKVLMMQEKLPEKLLSIVLVRLFSLICLTRNLEQGIPYLENGVRKLKNDLGKNHLEVGRAYMYLAAAYMRSGNVQKAENCYKYVQDIVDVSAVPHDQDSVQACQILSETFKAMGSYPLATKFQEKVGKHLEELEPRPQDELDEAFVAVEQLKKKVSSDSQNGL